MTRCFLVMEGRVPAWQTTQLPILCMLWNLYVVQGGTSETDVRDPGEEIPDEPPFRWLLGRFFLLTALREMGEPT